MDNSVRVIREMNRNFRSMKILVTADSVTFLERVKDMPCVYAIPGAIGHMEYDRDEDTYMKAFWDFLMISRADRVYLGRSGKMYKSEFARTAAMIHDKPFEIIAY